MDKVAGVVVAYFPDQEQLVGNITSYLSYVDLLVIIDNTPGPPTSLVELLRGVSAKILYVHNGENLGIAAALNKAADLAFEKGHAWLLTMDQDSYFESPEINKYFFGFRQQFSASGNVAIVAPSHDVKNEARADMEEYTSVASAITSGSLLHLKTWKTLNGFDEKLFIDEVDHEYCYRARANNFQIVRFNNIGLQHRMGKPVKAGYFGLFGKRERMIHSPVRLYFMVRNYLWVRKKYGKTEPEEFRMRDKQMRTIIKNNLFFSGKFGASLRSIWKGYRDYRKNDFSKKIQ